MRAVIKSGGADVAEPFRMSDRASVAAVQEQPDPRDIELAALRSAVARAEEALAEAEGVHRREVESAREQGRKKGLAEAEDREVERLKLLDKTLSAACDVWGSRLDKIDVLAPQLVRAAIARLFDGADDRAELVTAMLARRMRDLRRDSIVALQVSADDFSDEPALAALAASLAVPQVIASIDPTLTAGQARFALKLGTLDLDLSGEWRKVAAALEAMGCETE